MGRSNGAAITYHHSEIIVPTLTKVFSKTGVFVEGEGLLGVPEAREKKKRVREQ